MRKNKLVGVLFFARTHCTVNLGRCLGLEVGGRRLCVYVCLCVGGGGVCGHRDKVALWKGFRADRVSVSPVMLSRQGRMTHKHTISSKTRAGGDTHTLTHTHTNTHTQNPGSHEGSEMAGARCGGITATR